MFGELLRVYKNETQQEKYQLISYVNIINI